MYLSIQKLHPDAQLPVRATAQSAGYDLHAYLEQDVVLQPGEIRKIPTGIAAAPSRKDVMLCIFPRSGLASKFGISLANAVGVVDSDYRGELKVPMINLGTEPYTIAPGERVAQLCKDCGLTLTGAGAAFPYGIDPQDSHLRIAPTYPSLDEVETASELLCVCVRLAVVEKLLADMA